MAKSRHSNIREISRWSTRNGPVQHKLGISIGIFCLFYQMQTTNEQVGCLVGDKMEFIDSNSQFCCDGVHNRTNHRSGLQQCCHTNTTDENGKLVTKDTVYNTGDEMCCGGQLMKIRNHRGLECCGHIPYNRSLSFCCQAKIFRSLDFYCEVVGSVEIPVKKGEKVCSVEYTNGSVSVKVHIEKSDWDCCGTEYFDENSGTFCFLNQLWPTGTIVSECDGKPFDQSIYACCDDKYLKKLPDEIREKYSKIGADYVCINDTLIDMDKNQITKDVRVIPKDSIPCGKDHYYPTNTRVNTFCCDGVVRHAPRRTTHFKCCATELIDTTEFRCCNNTKIQATSTLDCCGGALYDRLSGQVCCGDQYLINSSYLCCQPQSSLYVPVKRSRGHDTCCGVQTFNAVEAHCCGGEVKVLAPNQECTSSGQVVTVKQERPKTIEKWILSQPSRRMMENINGTYSPKQEERLQCPFCDKSEMMRLNCEKRFGFKIYIKDIEEQESRTFLQVLVLNPTIEMKLWTKGLCRCFKKGKLYMFYTNRNLTRKMRVAKQLQLRFSTADVLSIIKGKYPRYKEPQCKLNRYLRKSAKSI